MIAQIAPTHCTHSGRVKQSAWYLADNAANADRDADADIHHRSAEAQTGPAKTDGRQREMVRAPSSDDDDKSQSIFLQKTQEN